MLQLSVEHTNRKKKIEKILLQKEIMRKLSEGRTDSNYPVEIKKGRAVGVIASRFSR